jgi:hypothetical protein
VLAVVARGSTGFIEFIYLGLGAASLWWAATTPVARLATPSGRPRPFVFVALATLALVSLVSLSLFAEPLIAGASLALVAAILVGLGRVLRSA